MPRTLVVVFAVCLIGLVASPVLAAKGGGLGDAQAEEEILHGVAVDLETISIDVASNGCTTEKDFIFLVRQSKSSAEVTVIRIQPDYCKGFVRNVTLGFKRVEVGLDDIDMFTIRNAFRGFPRYE